MIGRPQTSVKEPVGLKSRPPKNDHGRFSDAFLRGTDWFWMWDLFAYVCGRKVGDVLPMVGGMRVINGEFGCLNYHVYLLS